MSHAINGWMLCRASSAFKACCKGAAMSPACFKLKIDMMAVLLLLKTSLIEDRLDTMGVTKSSRMNILGSDG